MTRYMVCKQHQQQFFYSSAVCSIKVKSILLRLRYRLAGCLVFFKVIIYFEINESFFKEFKKFIKKVDKTSNIFLWQPKHLIYSICLQINFKKIKILRIM